MRYELKKELRFELIEAKKGIFSTTKSILIKANTHEDLEDWVHIFDRILKK